MNEEMKQLLNEVDTLKIQLSALRPLPEEALKKIQDALDIEYTYESNRIEGNTLTLQETALVVNEGVTISGKSMREHLEAINHTEAISYIKDSQTRYRDKRTYHQRNTRPYSPWNRPGKCREIPHRSCYDFR